MMMLLVLVISVSAVTVEQVHEGTGEDEEERRVLENVLPVEYESENHRACEERVEPEGNAERGGHDRRRGKNQREEAELS
jgi:hypothetical protein